MKFKSPLIIAALAVLAILAAACSQPPVDHYPTFSLAMDQLVGAGNWTAASHTAGKDDLLTVTGVTVKMPAKKAPETAPAEAGEDGQTAEAPKAAVSKDHALEIATVELHKPLDKKALDALIATANWQNQKETKLFDKLVLKGLRHHLAADPKAYDLGIEEVTLDAAALAAAGADAPAGQAGFLKALRLGGLAYKNFKMTSQTEGEDALVTVASATVAGVAFDGQPLPGLELIDPTGMAGVMGAMSAKSASIKDVAMKIGSSAEKVNFSMSMASAEEKDIKAMGAIGALDMSGFKMDIAKEGTGLPATITLDKLSMHGFDMSGYFQKMMPAIAAASLDPESADRVLSQLYTLADIFVAPMSLDDLAMSGLEFNLGEMMTLKMAEAKVAGPYKTGEIPASQKSSITGLEIILPESAEAAGEDGKDLYEFGQKFGMTRFVINAEGEGSYDPATGRMDNRTTRFEIKDLFKMTGSLELGGLTPDRLSKLGEIPLEMAALALMAPEATLGDMSLNSMTLKLEDQGLTDRVFKYTALMESEKGVAPVTAEDLRKQATAGIQMMMQIKGGQYLRNPEAVSKPLVDFLTKPGSLELRLAAEPPLGVKSVMATAGDQNKILDSLNLSLSANGQTAPALKFSIPQ